MDSYVATAVDAVAESVRTEVLAPVAPQSVADRGARFTARLLDEFLVIAAVAPGLLSLYGDLLDQKGKMPDLAAFTSSIVLSLAPWIALVALQWFLVATRGQTVGKLWMKLRIVRLDGSPVGFARGVLLRQGVIGLGTILPYVGTLLGLVDVLWIYGGETRCLHDVIAGTKVIDVTPAPPARPHREPRRVKALVVPDVIADPEAV